MAKRTAKHPHSHAREVALQALYQMEVGEHTLDHVLGFGWLNEAMDEEKHRFSSNLIAGVVGDLAALDRLIADYSHKHPGQISNVNRCILRMALFELRRGELENEIIIDDILNLTRKYEGEESVPFINGILDRHIQEREA